MTQRKRTYAWALCLVIVLTLFVSSAYAVREAGHVCHGAGCQICETVRQAEALVQSFALFAGTAVLALFLMRNARGSRIAAAACRFAPCTLISWKIRLND